MTPHPTAFAGQTQTALGILYGIKIDNRLAHLSFSLSHHNTARDLLFRSIPGHAIPLASETMTLPDELNGYLMARSKETGCPTHSFFLDRGSAFQRRVWLILASIPYGQTMSYGQLAEKLGNRALARAVGQACGQNPLALIIPCHRVIAAHGLGGFAGGATIKERLLEMERKNAG